MPLTCIYLYAYIVTTATYADMLVMSGTISDMITCK